MDKNEYKITKQISKAMIDEVLEVERVRGLTANALVDVAKDKNSALHHWFVWDDSKAGHEWRLQQARVLINTIKIKVGTKMIYAYENISIKTSDNKNERLYKPVKEILDNTLYRKQVVQTALKGILFWKQKYQEYAEFSLVVDAIEKTERRVKQKWSKKTKK